MFGVGGYNKGVKSQNFRRNNENHGTRKKENFRLWEEKPKNNGFSESRRAILKTS